jgi:small-conductance mechanosensitive channel
LNFGIVNFAENYSIMQTASFTSFIKGIIYFLAFYYIFKFLAKLFLPLLIKKVVEKAGTNFQNQQQNSYKSSWQKTPNNDEVIIDQSKSKKPRETKKIGEYVDYEEIE